MFWRRLPKLGKRCVSVNYCDTRITRLSNGLRVATEDMGLPTTTVGLWIDCGTRYERLEEMGTAHFFEHLVFKGSKIMSQEELTNYAEDTGTLLNAYTSREHTSYYFQGRRENTGKLVQILGDVINNPDMSLGSIRNERAVIVAEYDDILQNVQEVLFDYIHCYCFGGLSGGFTESSLSYNILGTKRHIKKLIDQKTIKNFIDLHYHPSRTILVAAGGVDHDEVVKYAKEYFPRSDPYIGPGTPTFERDATIPDPANDIYADFWKETKFHSCEMRHHESSSHQTVAGCIAYPSTGWSHYDSTTMLIVSQIIGVFAHGQGGYQFFTSPFTNKLQSIDPSGTFQSYMSLYNDIGLFGFIFTIFELDKGKEIVDAFLEELDRIANDLPDDELENAKKAMLTNISLVVDGTQPVADEIGRHLLVYGRRMHYPETKKLIESITKEDVSRCIKAMLEKNEKAICLIGNLEHTPTIFEDIPQITNPEKVHSD